MLICLFALILRNAPSRFGSNRRSIDKLRFVDAFFLDVFTLRKSAAIRGLKVYNTVGFQVQRALGAGSFGKNRIAKQTGIQ